MTGLLNRLRFAQVNSSVARRALSLYFREGRYYTIRFGPLKGLRLYYDRSVDYHAVLGLWDLEGFWMVRTALERLGFLNQPVDIADVGANIGYVSLWLSRIAPHATVHAFEPAPDVARLLRKNISGNNATNITPLDIACSDREGEIQFYVAPKHHCSSLVQSWASSGSEPASLIVARTNTLDNLFAGNSQRRLALIKMDIEGGGVFALPGCNQTVERFRPIFWIESHTPDEDRAISNLLVAHDYRAYRQQTHNWVTNIHATHPDPEGVWGSLLAVPKERYPDVEAAFA